MTAQERRDGILEMIKKKNTPISATTLAGRFDVSRQIIVGDIALLRAGGVDISSTPRGYVISRREEGIVRTVACIHDSKDTVKELYIMVDNGCTVIDVIVEHAVYGQLTGMLQISNRHDVDRFYEKISEHSEPLSTITGGIHLHTLRCPNDAAYDRVIRQLGDAGLLLCENS